MILSPNPTYGTTNYIRLITCYLLNNLWSIDRSFIHNHLILWNAVRFSQKISIFVPVFFTLT